MVGKQKKVLHLFISLVLVLTLLAACSNNSKTNNEPSPAPSKSTTTEGTNAEGNESSISGIDTSERVELQFYMLGNAPKDLDKVEAQVNEWLLEDLNATVKFNYTTWTDWDQKYRLLLSTGQDVDLIFTAEWTQYQQYAKNGAFMRLDELLPVAAPKLYEFVPQDMWEAVKIDGNIYTVPATYKEYVTGGFVWREDLRVKHNLPKPVDIETFEAYLAGIKQNEPNIQPLAVGQDVGATLEDAYLDFQRQRVGAMPYGLHASYSDPSNIVGYWGSEEHLTDLKRYKSWADNGYFSKNELNETDGNQDKLTNGTAAAMLSDNPTRYNSVLNQMKALHPDWDLAYHPYGLTLGYATPVHPIHNGFAVPKNSKKAERALAFYELMVTDKRYNLLTQYGFEDVNYTVEDGYYKMIGDNTTNGFVREAMNGWAWRNPEYMIFEPSYDGVEAIFNELDKIQVPDIYTGFAEDYTPYQAERAALEQVEKQYLYPLMAGLVDDVEDGLKTFMEKANQAGLEKIQESYKQQWLQYLQESGHN
ncbi:extracellular solute-binding protein [Paenibacillus camelliae]|uniref:extracellular solute-binding protein n=1 Tax=Paenibacillus camelliae TaxID=512410 RepID=UPI00203A6DE8|nr:extracellular solute-binding protein [Paenibacillus camelliae]MCM3632772.1 extracellular solute-binding protein [Paenibacillus camelliae]